MTKPTQRILALDLGHDLGWCIMEDGKVMDSGVERFSGERGEVFHAFEDWLGRKVLSGSTPTVFVAEKPHLRGWAASEVLMGFWTLTLMQAHAWEIPLESVHTGTLKKHITGFGNATKDAMCEAVSKRIGREITDDNEGDAIAVALWYWDTKTEVQDA